MYPLQSVQYRTSIQSEHSLNFFSITLSEIKGITISL